VSYISKDEQVIVKIIKHMTKLNSLYASIKNLTSDEIDAGIEGLALAQCITNLYELAIKIEDDDVSEKLSILRTGRVARMRNISAHEYDSVNWDIAKDTCRKIINQITQNLLDKCLATLAKNKSKIKDYTTL